jgi:hypothetical protein
MRAMLIYDNSLSPNNTPLNLTLALMGIATRLIFDDF